MWALRKVDNWDSQRERRLAMMSGLMWAVVLET
jgi:hypothetical protein